MDKYLCSLTTPDLLCTDRLLVGERERVKVPLQDAHLCGDKYGEGVKLMGDVL